MELISPVKFDALVTEVVESLPKRTRHVLVRRFGLRNGRHETLEAIGKDHDITRERVRQIESDGLKQLARPETLEKLAPAFQYLEDHFSAYGRVRGEEQALNHLAGESHPHPKRQAVLFLLTLGEPFQRGAEDSQCHAHWHTSQEAEEKARALIARLVSHFTQSQRQPIAQSTLLDITRAHEPLPEQVIYSYLDISKRIAKNAFGEYGLAEWPEISPRGVRDKAYLVLKRAQKPLHFEAITDLINQAVFDARKAFVQTVHNELIKDERFVLVGRGIYALAEWGYAPGTVRDVLETILRQRGPLGKEEIIKEASQRRLVKANTIVLNLQNPKFFVRLEDDRYTLKR